MFKKAKAHKAAFDKAHKELYEYGNKPLSQQDPKKMKLLQIRFNEAQKQLLFWQ